MGKYVDMVTINGVDGIKYMRTAPFVSGLEEGDEVMFQVSGHPFEIKGLVTGKNSVQIGSNEWDFIKGYAKEMDLRITKKITYKVFDYTLLDESMNEEEGELANG